MNKIMGFMLIMMSMLAWSDGRSFYDEGRGAETSEIKAKFLSMYGACIEEKGGYRNASVDGCSHRVLDVVSTEISTLYTELHGKMVRSDSVKSLEFQNSQQSWQLYRDNHCSLMSTYLSGLMENYCPMKMSIDRLVELKELSSNYFD